MDRKAFLSSIGLSAGTLLIASCLGACGKTVVNSGGSAPTLDFTLDLTQAANAALNTLGGYLYANGVIVAKTLSGNIIAVSQACTHQGVTVQYVSNNNNFYCPSHGASFSATGAATGGPTNGALKQYIVTVTGNTVRVNG
jgi:cytochrome b6-f complex iron-sulfur subunit